MNSLDDLLDRLSEQWALIWSRIEENSTYNTLREKFETLPSSAQRLTIVGSISFLIFVLFLIPITSIFSSSSYIDEFDEKRELVEKLLSAQQNSKQKPPLPPGISTQQIQSKVQQMIRSMRLIEGQGPELTPLNNNPAGKMVPTILKQSGLSVSLKGLNLKQTLDAGARLEALDPSVKMISLVIDQSAEFPKYYDVVFQLVSLDFPMPKVEDKPGSKNKNRRGSKKSSSKKSDRRSKKSGRDK